MVEFVEEFGGENAMLSACFVSCVAFLLMTQQTHQKAASVEFRLAETQYAEGLKEAIVHGTRDKVYLHNESVVSDKDIFQAHLVLGSHPNEFGVFVAFTRDGAEKISSASRDHKPLAVVIDEKVVAVQAVRVIDQSCTFTGLSKVEAEGIAKRISLASILALISDQGKIKLEFRLAQREPAKELTEAVERNTLQKVYLFKEVLISNKDILEARVVKGYMDGVFDVELGLTSDASGQVARTCESNKGKMLAVLINGRVVSAPFIIGRVSRIQISGDFTQKEAESIAGALNIK